MNLKLLKLGSLALCLLAPLGARAQGVVEGARQGADQGGEAAGPVGAIVGGAFGAVTGGIGGLLGLDRRPEFRDYVDLQNHPSDDYRGFVREGAVLPLYGIRYYDLPTRYGAQGYRYAVVNDQTVLVDPRDRKIVQVIN
jgi:hypothetical protein